MEISKDKRTSRILKFIYHHKILVISGITFFMCLTLNLILIFNFVKVLKSAY